MAKFPYKKYKIIWEDPTGDSAWLTDRDMDSLYPAINTTGAFI